MIIVWVDTYIIVEAIIKVSLNNNVNRNNYNKSVFRLFRKTEMEVVLLVIL